MVGIYARVSTEEQARSGYSLRDQIRECKKKAGTNEIVEYVDEGISGEFLDRPALTKLRQDVREGLITKVICLDPDRLSRRLMNQLLISDEIEKRAALEFVNGEYQQTPEGKLFYQMRGAISEFEKAKINERFSRGRREKARQGRVVRDYKVYGYTFNQTTSLLEIDPYESEIVKLIFQLFTDRTKSVQGINGIANLLNEKKIPTKRGAKSWHRQVVRQVLMNRAYIGEFYQNRWNTEGMMGNKYRDQSEKIPMRTRPESDWILVSCPPIIDEGMFNYAQKLLEVSRQRWSGISRHQYLLSGLVRCGKCNNTMTGRRGNNWGKYIYEYSDLKNTAGAKNRGCGHRIKAETLDEYVWSKILEWLNNPDEIDSASASETDVVSSFEEAEIERLEKILKEKEKGRKHFLKTVLDGKATGLDDEEIRQALLESKNEIEELKANLEELNKQMQHTENNKLRQSLLREASEHYLSKGLEELTFKDKQELIRFIIREIIVFDDEVRIIGL